MVSALLFVALLAGDVEAGSDVVDPRWVPWMGCWELVDDERREPVEEESGPVGEERVLPEGFVCLSPVPGTQGVTVATVSDGELFLEETLIADGTNRPSAKGNCDGRQRVEWSHDGHRLFTTAELTCDASRKLDISGLSMMTGSFVWVDIQVVQSGSDRAVMIRRYHPTEATVAEAVVPGVDRGLVQQARLMRPLITEPLGTDDIIEAAGKVAPEAVEAAVLEREAPVYLDAEALMRLRDAGVRPGLIDLMIALTYPEKFVVDRPSGAVSVPPEDDRDTLRYPYYVVPFDYYYWYAPHHRHYVVRPVPRPRIFHGVVTPEGYTRVVTRDGRRAHPRGDSAGSSEASSGEKSGGSASPEGNSGKAPTGRKAKPKKKKQ